MRMDQWIAVFGSEDQGDEELASDALLNTSSSWCDGNILWGPASEEQHSDDDGDDDILLEYSRSSSGESAADECSPSACDLRCVCVDCLQCLRHCSCNYTSHDYKCREIAYTGNNLRYTQVQDEVLSSRREGARPSTRERWSVHKIPSRSRPKKSYSEQFFMVAPNNIWAEASLPDTCSGDDDTSPAKSSSRSCHSQQQQQSTDFRRTFNSSKQHVTGNTIYKETIASSRSSYSYQQQSMDFGRAFNSSKHQDTGNAIYKETIGCSRSSSQLSILRPREIFP